MDEREDTLDLYRPLTELEAITLGCHLLETDERLDVDVIRNQTGGHYQVVLTLRKWRRVKITTLAQWRSIEDAWCYL